MKIRLIVDDILKASTELTDAQIGKLLINVCKSQLKLSKVDYIPKENERFLWDSFAKSRLISEAVNKKATSLAKARWSKIKQNKGETGNERI